MFRLGEVWVSSKLPLFGPACEESAEVRDLSCVL